MKTPVPAVPRQILTTDEEVTLRRVAHGQSEVRMMRAQDLATLRGLKLIDGNRDEPRLTPQGRKLFDALPRPSALSAREPFDMMLEDLSRITSSRTR